MSLQRREELVAEILDIQPAVRMFVRDLSTDMLSSWDLVAYSFQKGFEALWDLARVDHSGLLLRPLLSLWRQSVELAIKTAIIEIAGGIKENPRHDLVELFSQLLEVRAAAGCCDDDDLTRNVECMLSHIQSFDPFADRFRYPTQKGGKPYEGISVALDELFQAHWIIVTWCEGAAFELRERF